MQPKLNRPPCFFINSLLSTTDFGADYIKVGADFIADFGADYIKLTFMRSVLHGSN